MVNTSYIQYSLIIYLCISGNICLNCYVFLRYVLLYFISIIIVYFLLIHIDELC